MTQYSCKHCGKVFDPMYDEKGNVSEELISHMIYENQEQNTAKEKAAKLEEFHAFYANQAKKK